jgi:hypothetical protein
LYALEYSLLRIDAVQLTSEVYIEDISMNRQHEKREHNQPPLSASATVDLVSPIADANM